MRDIERDNMRETEKEKKRDRKGDSKREKEREIFYLKQKPDVNVKRDSECKCLTPKNPPKRVSITYDG